MIVDGQRLKTEVRQRRWADGRFAATQWTQTSRRVGPAICSSVCEPNRRHIITRHLSRASETTSPSLPPRPPTIPEFPSPTGDMNSSPLRLIPRSGAGVIPQTLRSAAEAGAEHSFTFQPSNFADSSEPHIGLRVRQFPRVMVIRRRSPVSDSHGTKCGATPR